MLFHPLNRDCPALFQLALAGLLAFLDSLLREFDDLFGVHGVELSVRQNNNVVDRKPEVASADLLVQRVVAQLNGVQLDSDGLLELADRAFEELVVVGRKLGLHPAEVLPCEHKQLSRLHVVASDGEYALQRELVPVF